MNKFLKTLLISVSIVLLAWLLPATYHFVTTQKTTYPFIIYSSLLNDFLIKDRDEKSNVYKDRKGNVYTQAQTDSLVPTLYYRLLVTESRMPDTVLGVALTPQLIKHTNFFFRHSPSDVNGNLLKLYPLLESHPKRMELAMPDDICRFTDSEIQFIDMEKNAVNQKKSKRFQHVFQDKGVDLPIKAIGGNPTARKEYDEGYFFTDSRNQLFHLKQMAGNPYLKKIDLADDMIIEHIFVTEFANQTSYAFITDQNNRMFVITAPDYRLVKTGMPAFNPKEDDIFIMGNMFDWNVELSNKSGRWNIALNAADYSLIDSLYTPIVTTEWEKASTYLFPFELTFTSLLDKFFYPRVSHVSVMACFFNILLAIAFLFIFRRSKRKDLVFPFIGIVALGLFAFIPFWLFNPHYSS